MSTRANIIIKDEHTTLYLYRHSDGYPTCTGEDLKAFVEGYTSGAMRSNASQSAGWLILRGNAEYKVGSAPNPKDSFAGWKVGAYEPTDTLHSDVEYIYVIDLDKGELRCHKPVSKHYWGDPSFKHTKEAGEFKVVKFKLGNDI